MKNNKEPEEINNIVEPRGVLPTGSLEFADSGNWYKLATENFVNVVAKLPVAAATTTDLSATYNNGTSGEGATLTSSTNAALVVDNYVVQTNDRILVKDFSNPAGNGVYVVTSTGSASAPWILTRAKDFNSSYLFKRGVIVPISNSGTTLAKRIYMYTSQDNPTIGTTGLVFELSTSGGALTIAGTTNQIIISGSAANPVIGIATDPYLPGNGGVRIPGGSLAERPATPYAGTLRYNNNL
jgi:hypothetical protein